MTRRRMPRLLAAVAGLAVVAGVVFAPPAQVTEAVWVDAEHATASVSALELERPTAGTCTVSTHVDLLGGIVLDSVTLTWSSPHPPANAHLTATQAGTTKDISDKIEPPSESGGTYFYHAILSRTFLTSLLENLLGSTATLTVTNIVPGSTWESPSHTRQLSVGLLGLNPTCT